MSEFSPSPLPPQGPESEGSESDRPEPQGSEQLDAQPQQTQPPDLQTPVPTVEPLSWQRLDTRMLLVNPVQELIRFLPIVIGAFVLGSGSDRSWWQLAGVAIPVTLGVIRYLTTRYRITPTQVELQRGLIGTKVLTAPLDRVRAVELTSSPIHRILGLAKVEIGTASAGREGTEKFVLDSLPLAQARDMRVALLHRAEPPSENAGSDETTSGPREDVVLLRFDRRWVRYAPLTSSGNVIAAGLLAVLGQFGDALGEQVFDEVDVADWASKLSLAIAIPVVVLGFLVAFLILGAVFSVLGYLITNWNFTLSRDARGRSFHVRRGLFTSTETSLERERVRGLEVIEPLGLRMVGAARLAAIVTGVSGGESSRSQLVPPAPRGIVDATGAEVLDLSEPLHLPLTTHGPAARRRRYTRALLGAIALPVVAVVAMVATPVDWWVVLPTLLAVPVALLLAADRYRRLGHALSEGYLVVRSGSLRGRRDVLQRSGIIGWNVQQSWFQRRAGLVTLVATTAAGHQAYAALDIPEELAVELADTAVPGLVTPFLA